MMEVYTVEQRTNEKPTNERPEPKASAAAAAGRAPRFRIEKLEQRVAPSAGYFRPGMTDVLISG
jgi:hypothetical protein